MAYKCGSCGTFFTGRICPVCGVRSPVAMIGRPRDLALARMEQLTPRTVEDGETLSAAGKPRTVMPAKRVALSDASVNAQADIADIKETDAGGEKTPPEKKSGSVDLLVNISSPENASSEKKSTVGNVSTEKAVADERPSGGTTSPDVLPTDGKASGKTTSPDTALSDEKKAGKTPSSDMVSAQSEEKAKETVRSRATPAIPDFSSLPKPPRPAAESETTPRPVSEGTISAAWADTPSPPPGLAVRSASSEESEKGNAEKGNAEKENAKNGLPNFTPVPISVRDAAQARKLSDRAASGDTAKGCFADALGVLRNLLRGDVSAASKDVLTSSGSLRLGLLTLPVAAAAVGILFHLRGAEGTAGSLFSSLLGSFAVTLVSFFALAFVFLAANLFFRTGKNGEKTGKNKGGEKSEKKGEKKRAAARPSAGTVIRRSLSAAAFSMTAPAVFALLAVFAELLLPSLVLPIVTVGCGMCFILLWQTVHAASENACRRGFLWFSVFMIPAVYAVCYTAGHFLV